MAPGSPLGTASPRAGPGFSSPTAGPGFGSPTAGQGRALPGAASSQQAPASLLLATALPGSGSCLHVITCIYSFCSTFAMFTNSYVSNIKYCRASLPLNLSFYWTDYHIKVYGLEIKRKKKKKSPNFLIFYWSLLIILILQFAINFKFIIHCGHVETAFFNLIVGPESKNEENISFTRHALSFFLSFICSHVSPLL